MVDEEMRKAIQRWRVEGRSFEWIAEQTKLSISEVQRLLYSDMTSERAALRAERKAAGLCVECGGPRDEPDILTCRACREKTRAYAREYRRKKAGGLTRKQRVLQRKAERFKQIREWLSEGRSKEWIAWEMGVSQGRIMQILKEMQSENPE